MSKWEEVHDEPGARVRRLEVPGGWLYQVEINQRSEGNLHESEGRYTWGWNPPVFVSR